MLQYRKVFGPVGIFVDLTSEEACQADFKIRDEIRKSYDEDSFFKPIVENPE